MKQIHDQEREQFKKLFQQENIDCFEERFKVLEAFLQTENHVTVSELMAQLNNSGHAIDERLVRDTLRLMSRFGFARKNRFQNGEVRYEHRHLGQHHDHMICTKCHGIFEFHDNALERLQIKIAEAHGFHMLQHRMEIYGICAGCAQERLKRMTLPHARPGEKVNIVELEGGASARMRLASMGFRVGDEIEVITNNNVGQMVVAADFKRYVIGRGLAQKIIVKTEK